MYFYRVYWANVILGGFCTFAYAMTIPIYYNLGGEITFPIGEAHSTALNAFTMNMVGLILVEIVKESFTDSFIFFRSVDFLYIFFIFLFMADSFELVKNLSFISTRGTNF